MTSSLKNSVQLIGNTGKDVVLTTFENGNKKAALVLATNDYYTNNKGEKVKQTEWHNLVAWGKTAELMGSLGTKGAKIAIAGKIANRSYEDKTGVKKYITEIIVDEFMLVSQKAKSPF